MDKLRGILSPGKDKDDQVMYGSEGAAQGDSSGNTGKLSGQGSHFGAAEQQATGVGADSSAPSTTMTHGAAGQTGNTATNPSGTTGTGSGTTGTGSGTTGTGLGQNTNTGSTAHPAANTAANRAAGTYGQDTSGAFPQERENPYKTSNLDPRVDSQPRGTTTQPTSTQPGTRQDYSGPRETGNYGGNAGALPEHEKSHAGRDAGLAAGAGTGAAALGAHEHDKHNQSTTGATNTYDSSRSTNAGPHDSNLANKADPRVDSDRDGRVGLERTGNTSSTGAGTDYSNTSGTNTTGQDSGNKPSMLGRAAAAVGVGSAKKDRDNQNTSDNTTSGTTGQGTTSTGGAKDDHHNQYHTPAGAEAREHGKDPSPNVHPTHGSARAPSFLGNLTGDDSTGLEGSSNQPSQEGTGRHHGAETAAAAAGTAGIAEHEANKHHQGTTSQPGYDSGISQARGGAHPSLTDRTAGNTTGYDQPTSTTGTTQPREHHGARDAALAGGAGAGLGGAAYEAERHHDHSNRQTGTAGGLNQPASTSGSGYNQPSSGTGYGSGYDQPSSTLGNTQGNTRHGDSHLGRDAALAGGAGAAYEGERHHHHHGQQQGTTGGLNQPSSTTGFNQQTSGAGYDQQSSTLGNTQGSTRHGDSHLGRDAGVAGVAGAGLGGIAAHESGRHHQAQPDAHTITTAGPTSSGTGGNYDNQRFEPTSRSGYGQQSSTTGTTQPREHHTGRDAALGGAAGAGLGGAAYEAEKHHHQGSHDPTQPRQPIQPTQPKAPTEPREPYGATQHDQHHLGRDAAVGTAAVGGTGVHGHEQSREFSKEQKAHDKALAKEERREEKAERKEEKQHEKALAKEEKHHDHHHGHEEKEKKPGLIDRLLHRGKNDDDEVPEGSKHVHPESQHIHPGAYGAPAPGAEVPAGTGAAGGGAYEYEKHHQHPKTTHDAGVTDPAQDSNRLYKEPPSGAGTGYAEAPTQGYASQVTGGTGTTALAQGEGGPRDSHLSGAGNTLDPSVGDRQTERRY